MHIRSSLPDVVLLLACKISIDDQQSNQAGHFFYKFPNDRPPNQDGPSGLWAYVDTQTPVLPQLVARAEKFFERKPLVQSIEFVENYRDVIVLDNPENKCAQLYVAHWKPLVSKEEASGWLTIPEMLRSLSSGKTRLAYLRAFQVLQGGLTQEIDAVDTKDLK